MDIKSQNTILIPLDIPEVEVTGMQVNERGDYISPGRKHAICQHCGRRIMKFNRHEREIELGTRVHTDSAKAI
jgi:hypothetical protein